MKNYVDNASSLEFLKMDSGLLPKPSENWNTFEPQEGDLALVGDIDYIFIAEINDWIPVVPEKEEALDE